MRYLLELRHTAPQSLYAGRRIVRYDSGSAKYIHIVVRKKVPSDTATKNSNQSHRKSGDQDTSCQIFHLENPTN